MAQQQFQQPKRKSQRGAYGQAGNEDSAPLPTSRDADSSAAIDDAQNTLGNIDDVLADNTQAASREGLKGAEANPTDPSSGTVSPEESRLADDTVGGGFRQEGGQRKKFLGRLSTTQKAAGGGLIGAAIAGVIAVSVLFSPILRLESYMARINQRAFALASSAVEARMGHLFERYMVSHMLSLQTCRTARTIDCRVNYGGGIASNLFNGWRDVRIEQKLFDRYGIQVDFNQNTRRYNFKDKRGNSIVLERDGSNFKSAIFQGSSRESGREMRHFLRAETKWYQVMERRSVRKYLARKHNMKLWCFFACKTRDNVELRTADAKTRFKYRFVERFVMPFSGKYGFIMNCLVSGTPGSGKCSSSELRKSGVDRVDLPEAEVTKIIGELTERPNLRLSQVVFEKLLAKIMSQTAARTVVSSIPVAGQIYFGLVVIDTFDKMDTFIANKGLSKFAAEINASQYLEFYAGMRSANDEMKAGDSKLEDVGELMSQFDGAEESKVYKAYNRPATEAAWLGGTAFAQSSSPAEGKEPYLCADGQPIKPSEHVCEEKKIARNFSIEVWRNNSVVNGLVSTLNAYSAGGCYKAPNPCTLVRPTLTGIRVVADFIFGPIAAGGLTIIRAIPGVGSIAAFIEEKAKDLMTAFFHQVFPLPVGIESPGRERYDGLEAGADVAATEFAKGGYAADTDEPYGLGAPTISDDDAYAVYQDYFEQQAYDYQNSGFIARLTDLEYRDSFANAVLARLPTRLDSAGGQIASGLLQNLANFFSLNLFSSFLNPPSAFAQNGIQQQLAINAFGVTRHGFALDDPIFKQDPDILTEEYCQATAKTAWQDSMTENKTTGFDEYSVANPCLLEEVVVEAAGAVYGIGDEGVAGTVPSGGTAAGLPQGNIKTIATNLLGYSNVTWRNSLARAQVQTVADTGAGEVDHLLIRVLAGLALKHSYAISSIKRCTPGIGAGTNSLHCVGKAADISGAGGIDGAAFGYDGHAPTIQTFLNTAAALLPDSCQIGVPNQQYVDYTKPVAKSGCSVFIDAGTGPHIHIGVPR